MGRYPVVDVIGSGSGASSVPTNAIGTYQLQTTATEPVGSTALRLQLGHHCKFMGYKATIDLRPIFCYNLPLIVNKL